MAQPPDISETFRREVDENLRRDQARDFLKDYGKWLIAAVILFLVASGGYIWWKQNEVKKSEAQVEKLAQLYTDIGTGKTTQAPQQLDQLAASGSASVGASARFARAALAIQQGDTKLALATYKSIAADDDLAPPYRHAALIRQTAIEFDQLPPQEVISRLEPLAKAGEPWFGSAGEMTALALIKQGKQSDAGHLYAAISKDNGVPETLRARARQVAGSLGVDVGAAAPSHAQ